MLVTREATALRALRDCDVIHGSLGIVHQVSWVSYHGSLGIVYQDSWMIGQGSLGIVHKDLG